MIHPKGDFKNLVSGDVVYTRNRRDFVNDNEIILYRLASSVEEYRKKEKEENEKEIRSLRQEAKKFTPGLDRYLLKKNVPEIFVSSNKNSKQKI